MKREQARVYHVSEKIRRRWSRLEAFIATLATVFTVIIGWGFPTYAWADAPTMPPVVAQEPFTLMPDGRYIIDFHGHRFALVRWGDGYDPSVNLCFVGQPKNFPHGKDWDRRIWWTLTRILEDSNGFRKELAQAKSITTYQGIPTTKIEVQPEDRSLLPLSARGARMFLTIKVSAIDDEPCPGSGHPYSEMDDTRRFYEGVRHEGYYLDEVGPLLIYRNSYDRRIATGKIERPDREFSALGPVYLSCVSYTCTRYAVNNGENIEMKFDFVTGMNGIDPTVWVRLDRYFHETTSCVFLDHLPNGIE